MGDGPPNDKMPQSYINLNYHIVFSTKNRVPVISAEYEPRLHEYIGGIVRSQGGVAVAVGGTADHVHVLARMRQDKALSDLIRELKAGASGWMHDVFPELREFAWQNGYGAFTVSQSLMTKAKTYVDNQHQRHQKTSFRDEFLVLLKAHEIEFDERYLFR
jgi:REP element-mobilizing transposase RayT